MVSGQFRKSFVGAPFCGGWTKNIKIFSRHLFQKQPSKYCIWFIKIIIFDSLKLPNVSNLFLEKGAAKKNTHTHTHKFLILLKGRYYLMGGHIDINVGVFWEASVGFLKSVVLQLFPKYSQSNVKLNVKSKTKFNCL